MAEKALPGVLRWNLGDLTITAINDGWFQAGLDLVTGIPQAEAGALQKAAFRPEQPKVTLNAFLITGPGREPVLIDAGYGGFAPVGTLGRFAEGLALIGVRPEEIGTVLVSHLHPDHVGGLVKDGAAFCPNAEIVLNADEAAHWLTDEALSKAPDADRPYFENARAAMAPYAGRIREHRGGEVLPGVTAVPLPGHTPGHTGFRIVSGDASLMMWTDIVHIPAVQFKNPQAGVGFDVDGERARETRKRILDEVASEGSLVAGSHLEFPALGYVARDGAGYAFVPALWVGGE